VNTSGWAGGRRSKYTLGVFAAGRRATEPTACRLRATKARTARKAASRDLWPRARCLPPRHGTRYPRAAAVVALLPSRPRLGEDDRWGLAHAPSGTTPAPVSRSEALRAAHPTPLHCLATAVRTAPASASARAGQSTRRYAPRARITHGARPPFNHRIDRPVEDLRRCELHERIRVRNHRREPTDHADLDATDRSTARSWIGEFGVSAQTTPGSSRPPRSGLTRSDRSRRG
jgi:hypothetical protein